MPADGPHGGRAAWGVGREDEERGARSEERVSRSHAPRPTPHAPRPASVGVLLMAYGTPETPEQVEPYFTHIRGGRKPSPEAVEHLSERYVRVGGRTPLLDITRQVTGRLQERLNAGSGNYRVYAEARERLGRPFEVTFVESWHDNPRFLDMMARLVREGLAQFAPDARDQVVAVFSAHSLPARIREWDDPYERELLASSAAVAERVGLRDWRFAFQSESATGEPWLGPDILDTLERLAGEGKRQVLQVPIGFVSDHLEILYDIDVEAREKAAELGMTFHRTRLPNVREDFIETLASIVSAHAPAVGDAATVRPAVESAAGGPLAAKPASAG